jgi:predicted transcriptional regulator
MLTDILRRDRKREGLRLARAAWLLGVTVRELREIEAGERYPSFDTYDRIQKLFGWPQAFVGERRQ